MKKCYRCKEEKQLKDFYKKSDRKKGTAYCKKCFNSYCCERWTQKKLKAIDYKGGCCELCGYNKCHGALQFHHIDPKTKKEVWTKLRLKSWEKITLELDKCSLLCANCHAEAHTKPLSS